MDWKNDTLQSMWKLNKEKLIFIFCSGLLLFVLSLPGDKDSFAVGNFMGESVTGEEGELLYTVDSQNGNTAIVGSTKASVGGISYEEELEMRVREILAGVEGVGEVEVMVVLKASEETSVYNGFSEKSVYPELSGIVISADGGGSAVVKSEISEAMEALFGLPTHKIKVLKRVKKGV